MLPRVLLLATSAIVLAHPLAAQPLADPSVATIINDIHGPTGSDIVVTAPFVRDRFALPTSVSVLEAESLARETRSTIGETLARQPGVSASFFGPNASRPILRGLEGERVRVLTDGIGSFDVSNTSVDHAVVINPLIAERIEVVRGPASLLYGSSAIGGVVNVITSRIPRALPEGPFHFHANGALASVNEERSIAGALELPLGTSGLIAHADGSYLRTGNYRTGGYIFSRELRAEAARIGGEAAEDAEARGRVLNTDARTWEAAGGLAFVKDGAHFGVSISRYESNYGIPNGLDLDDHDGDDDDDHEEGHEDIRLDMRQTRVDARAEIPLFGAFEQLRFRFGWADYVHDEVEPSGEIGTRFTNESLESRIELVQAERGGWRGASGAQYLHRRFEAAGEEAFVPLNITDQFGLFTLQSVRIGSSTLELGGRYEHSRIASAVVGVNRRFDAFSGSAGLSVPLGSDDWRLVGSLAYSERAPSAEEMFADGPHAATGTFEIGDPDFAKERSLGLEAAIRGRGEGFRVQLGGFYNDFRNFIYLSPTGEEEDELPVFLFLQQGARFWGIEAEGAFTLFRAGDTRVELTGLLDYVRASLNDGGGVVPRIPPLRVIGGIEASGGVLGGRLEVEHATRQDRVQSFETGTPAYTLVNASLVWRPFGSANPTAIVASLNNVFDVEARRHASFVKDIAPLPGRDFRLAARFSF